MLKIKKRSKKTFLLCLIAVLVVGLGSVLLLGDHMKKSAKVAQDSTEPQQEINLEPATEEDAQRVDQNKQAIVDRERQLQSQQPDSGKKTLKPIITYAGQYGDQIEVGAYVNVFEDGGTCTTKFTNGNRFIVKSVKAIKNVNSTDCPAMVAGSEELSPKGNWTVVVSYDSVAASGTSDSRLMEVK